MDQSNVANDLYRGALIKIVAEIAPKCLDEWSQEADGFDQQAFSKATVDLAEALMAEIGKRNAPAK